MKPGRCAALISIPLGVWLSACSLLSGRSQPTATAIPTPQVLRVGFSPAARPVQAALSRCAQANPGISLFVTEAPPTLQPWPELDGAPVDLFIRLGAGEQFDGFAAQIAAEAIVVILPASSPVSRLTGQQVRSLFSGEIQSWAELGGSGVVQPYIFPTGDETRAIFDSAVLSGESYSQLARLAPGPEAMAASVSSDPAAIGYLPAAWLSPQIHPAELDPDLSRALTQPVLALAPVEPVGATRIFLSCLQTGEGQDELEKTFPP